jgi:hypothetical protein
LSSVMRSAPNVRSLPPTSSICHNLQRLGFDLSCPNRSQIMIPLLKRRIFTGARRPRTGSQRHVDWQPACQRRGLAALRFSLPFSINTLKFTRLKPAFSQCISTLQRAFGWRKSSLRSCPHSWPVPLQYGFRVPQIIPESTKSRLPFWCANSPSFTTRVDNLNRCMESTSKKICRGRFALPPSRLISASRCKSIRITYARQTP